MPVREALASFLLAGLAAAQGEQHGRPGDLRVGHWVEVRGTFDEDGDLRAEKVEVKTPGDEEVLLGTVRPEDLRSWGFLLFGQPIEVTDRTTWRKVERDGLGGKRVKVAGHWRGPQKFSSRSVALRDPGGRDHMEGRVDDVDIRDDGVLLTVMRFHVLVPNGAEVVLDAPLDELPLAPELVRRRTGDLTVRRDEDDLFGRGIHILDDLVLRGQLEWRVTDEDDFDLNEARRRDRVDYEATARLRLVWAPSPRWYAVAEGRYVELWRDEETQDRLRKTRARLGETFVYVRDAGLPGWDLQVGRQDFDDPREWVYDQNLDAVRAIGHVAGTRVELSASTTVTDGNVLDESATNLIAYLSREDPGGDTHMALWSVYRDFDLEPDQGADERRLLVGARALGEYFVDQESWLELSALRGTRGDQELSGWAYDAGTTWSPDFLGPFAITVGYALGSGGHVDGDEDRRYRQTGFQDNNARFAGVTSYRYYGELVDPELSNLGIATVAVGARVADRTSVDLVLHAYRQDQILDSIVDSNLKSRPDGVHADLGWELDLVVGSRRWRSFDLELVGGWFRPGDAFPDGDDAYLAKIQLRYRF